MLKHVAPNMQGNYMNSYKYIGFLVKQRQDAGSPVYFAFYATARDVLKWATIRKVEDSVDGTQRVLRPPREKAITRFLESNSINTIPNSVLIAFSPSTVTIEKQTNTVNACNNEANQDLGYISFSIEDEISEQDKPALIVDGQHRIHGMAKYDAENIPILIVALLDASLTEQAFQFIVVNNKAVKVETHNVKAIIANFDDTELHRRLLDAGVKYGKTSPLLKEVNDLDVSPFKGLLDWPNNRSGERIVPVSAIETAIKIIKSEFILFRDDEDSALGIFFLIWNSVRDRYPDQWGYKNTFMKKVNLLALHEFLIEKLKAVYQMGYIDILSSDDIKKNVTILLLDIPSEYWTRKWSVRVQDNANVRGMIRRDLEVIVQNSKMKQEKWDVGLKLVKPE